MFIFIRIMLLNLIWLFIAGIAVIQQFGWEIFALLTIWSALEMYLMWEPLLRTAWDGRESVDG